MKKPLKLLRIFIWTASILILGMTFYVNYYMPHGLRYPTGEIVCQEIVGHERCGEKYIEDTSQLDIPNWARQVRENWLGWMFILFAISAWEYSKDNKEVA